MNRLTLLAGATSTVANEEGCDQTDRAHNGDCAERSPHSNGRCRRFRHSGSHGRRGVRVHDGDQQHSRADDQNRAEDIEDGGADAAGAGQGSAAVVLDGYQMVSAGCCICLTVLMA